MDSLWQQFTIFFTLLIVISQPLSAQAAQVGYLEIVATPLSDSTAMVEIETSIPAIVEYKIARKEKDLDSTYWRDFPALENGRDLYHRIWLDDLDRNKTYYVRIRSRDLHDRKSAWAINTSNFKTEKSNNVLCSPLQDQVCGANGITYRNRCTAEEKFGIDVRYEGKCKKATNASTQVDEALIDQVAGKILLAVEANGEAWYVDPATRRRYYLADGNAAYQAFQTFGLGITTSNISKILPSTLSQPGAPDDDQDGLENELEQALGTSISLADTDHDGMSDKDEIDARRNPLGRGNIRTNGGLINAMKGRILLQVQDQGQAWYVYPDDERRYFLKNGDAAYDVMRQLGLGITNANLEGIPIGQL